MEKITIILKEPEGWFYNGRHNKPGAEIELDKTEYEGIKDNILYELAKPGAKSKGEKSGAGK